MNSTPIRRDIYVYNEATGMICAAGRLTGKGVDSFTPAWRETIAAGELIPMELYQDDPFILRLVVGGPLTVEEEEQWVGRIDWKLTLPDGELLICGGSEFIEQQFDEPDDYQLEYARQLQVPPGNYRASLLVYYNSVNGQPCVQNARDGDEPEPLGKWFRKTWAGTEFPIWLKNACVLDPDEDPGHEEEWENVEAAEDPNRYYVDFLLHLTPLGEGEKPTMPELEEHGWCFPRTVREPARCPMGLPAHDVEFTEDESNSGETAETPVLHDVTEFTREWERRPLDGRPVPVRMKSLHQLFRLAWAGHCYSYPTLTAVLPDEDYFVAIEDAALTVEQEGTVVRIGMSGQVGSQSACLRALAGASDILARLPEGTLLELDAATGEPGEDDKPPCGLHRYQGVVREGQFWIQQLYPPAPREILKEALQLSSLVDVGHNLPAATREMRDKVLGTLAKHPFFSDNPATAVGEREIGLSHDEPLLRNYVFAEIFKVQFGGTWEVFDLGEDDDEEADEEEEVSADEAGTLLLRGAERRLYFEVDAETLMDPDCAEPLQRLETGLLALGFRRSGDLKVSTLPHVLYRGFVHMNKTDGAGLILVRGGGVFPEFISRFSADASLTTTSFKAGKEKLFQNKFRTQRQGATLEELWREHESRAAFLGQHFGVKTQFSRSMTELAEAVERSMVRESSAEPSPDHLFLWECETETDPLVGHLFRRRYFTVDPYAADERARAALEAADALILPQGFRLVGSLINSFTSDTLFRGYLSNNGTIWATHYLILRGPEPESAWQFSTCFADGGVLMSVRQAMSRDEPKKKLYRVLGGEMPPLELLAKHRERLEKLKLEHGGAVQEMGDAGLLEFAREVERQFEAIL